MVTVGRHDLGSVLIPENEAAELAVEVNQQGVPTMVWMVTPNGRYNITAYAAPKTGSLWREVVTEIAESLRNDSAQVSVEDGPWGREVVGLMTNGPEPVVMRFVGVDGYRWMVRGAAIGTPESADAIARRRAKCVGGHRCSAGRYPAAGARHAVPAVVRVAGRAAARPRRADGGRAGSAGRPAAAAPPEPQPVARRSEQGSAMQQLRTITGG